MAILYFIQLKQSTFMLKEVWGIAINNNLQKYMNGLQSSDIEQTAKSSFYIST